MHWSNRVCTSIVLGILCLGSLKAYTIPRNLELGSADLIDPSDPISCMSDPSVEYTLALADERPQQHVQAPPDVRPIRQATRASIVSRQQLTKRRTIRQPATRTLNPRDASASGAVADGYHSTYKLEAGGLPFYPGLGYLDTKRRGVGGLLSGVIVLRDVEDCNARCQADSRCSAFTWYSNASPGTGQGHCYLLSVSGFLPLWWRLDRNLAPAGQSGTYFVDGRTCANNALTREFPGSTCQGAVCPGRLVQPSDVLLTDVL